jgi:hypothetical protein
MPSPLLIVADAAVGTISSSKPDCEILCDDTVTPYCSATEHLAWNDDEPGVTWLNGMRRLGSHPYECWEGSCESEHDEGLCNIVPAPGDEVALTAESREAFRRAVAAADAAGIQAFLEAHPSQLSFNSKRSAIQVISCSGRLSEHIPLPSEIVRLLVAASD